MALLESSSTRALPAMTEAELRMFSRLIREQCGLHYGPETQFLMEQRVARRVRETEAGSFAAYHWRLRSDPSTADELATLIDDLTTNETYFLREREQLEALVDELLPEAIAARRLEGAGPAIVWSAGCASGEEPYSIVILALERGLRPGVDFRILASDVSRRALQRARRGVYRDAAFRETDDSHRQRWFEERDEGTLLAPEVRRHVELQNLNLVDARCFVRVPPADVILCRNVMIYFDAETRRSVVSRFARRLRPGGHLLVGRSESLLHVSNEFELRHLQHDMVHRLARPAGDVPGGAAPMLAANGARS